MMHQLDNKIRELWANDHKAMTKRGLKLSFQIHRDYNLAKDSYTATAYDNFLAFSYSIRDRIVERWINTQQSYHKKNVKRVYYLSLEFLIGRLLSSYITNFDLSEKASNALKEIGYDLEDVCEQEIDAGLGNGGLGRLAACFLDSMATLSIPAQGYGIRYDYGIFHQKIVNGCQIEMPDEWLSFGNPWEFCRPEYSVKVKFYGRTEQYKDEKGYARVRWVDTQDVIAVPYDTPILGYGNDVVNTLRLWSAKATKEFDLDFFNDGDYEKAVGNKIITESISKVLYPSDNSLSGRELRLKQEYFFAAASIADILRRFFVENNDLNDLPEKAVIQLNDTHPILAILELMHRLLDFYFLDWEKAWDITKRCFAYTNHTLLPEALETWSVPRLEHLLPRHMQIAYEINDRFLKDVRNKFPNDDAKVARMSIIQEGEPKRVRMANLGVVGSFSVNGVSRLHTDLLKSHLFKDFEEMFPGRLNNKTNGITQRRWLLQSNPKLAHMITSLIGDRWVRDLGLLKELLKFKDDPGVIQKVERIKRYNKLKLCDFVHKSMGIPIDDHAIFDTQVKRIHEYKRQLMFTLYIISEYLKIKNNPASFVQPRTFFIGGKAAPAYTMAKLHIKFINSIADIINNDPAAAGKLKVVFLENYCVSLAQRIFPASDLSEQISTAGMEASGTGNMKFMLNGALTIGTLDGANVEINENVGVENIFIFGHKADEILNLRQHGYSPQSYINNSPVLQEICRLISNNFFEPGQPGLFKPILDSISLYDPFFVCADFDSYCRKQEEVSAAYKNKKDWTAKSLINIACAGPFSSDRTIAQYADEIWKIPYKK